MSNEILSQSQIYEQMKEFLIANQNSVTDFNNNSALTTQLKAVSIQINQALIKAAGGFKRQFETIPFNAFNIPRKAETFASGTAVFTRVEGSTQGILIPIKTAISTSGGQIYETTEEGTIDAGNDDSSPIAFKAAIAGKNSNVGINVINIINTSLNDVRAVNNDTAASGGTDREGDADYFTRFADYLTGLSGSNKAGITYAVEQDESIQSSYIEEHFPPENGLYNFTVYVDDGSGNVPQQKLDDLKTLLVGDGTEAFPGRVCPGINTRVLSASLEPITVQYTVVIDPLANVTDESIIQTVTDYVDELRVGENVIHSSIVCGIQAIPGVLSVTTVLINNSPADIVVPPPKVARTQEVSSI